MVRNIPVGDDIPSNINHPLLPLLVLATCIAATLAIVSSLCGSLTRKKAPPSSPIAEIGAKEASTQENEAGEVISPNEGIEAIDVEGNASQENGEGNAAQPLPPPPGMTNMRAASYHVRSTSTSSSHGKGKLAMSMSMRAPTTKLGSRQASKRDASNHQDKKRQKNLKHEDSIWKKTIILGEKCKVPDDDEDTVIYDEKGRKISAFHRKTPTGISLSRQSSNVSNAVQAEEEKS